MRWSFVLYDILVILGAGISIATHINSFNVGRSGLRRSSLQVSLVVALGALIVLIAALGKPKNIFYILAKPTAPLSMNIILLVLLIILLFIIHQKGSVKLVSVIGLITGGFLMYYAGKLHVSLARPAADNLMTPAIFFAFAGSLGVNSLAFSENFRTKIKLIMDILRLTLLFMFSVHILQIGGLQIFSGFGVHAVLGVLFLCGAVLPLAIHTIGHRVKSSTFFLIAWVMILIGCGVFSMIINTTRSALKQGML